MIIQITVLIRILFSDGTVTHHILITEIAKYIMGNLVTFLLKNFYDNTLKSIIVSNKKQDVRL